MDNDPPNLIQDLQYRILVEIDFETLQKLCQTDKYHYDVCYSDQLWIDRIVYEFGNESLMYKNKKVSWYEFYIILYIIEQNKGKLSVINELDRFSVRFAGVPLLNTNSL